MKNLKNITLEMSFKPFKKNDLIYIESVCKEMFDQWKRLLKYTDMVSVLLWTSDGSEILDYKGNMDEKIEWAKYIGGANPREDWDRDKDPNGIGLHTVNYLYIENPPEYSYRDLKNIVELIRRVGYSVTGKQVRVGTTFDPGPEFAKSEFKYVKHEEICLGDTMGKKSFVCCYGKLHEDQCKYAAYPDGIPEGTPFGSFFGKQSNVFLKDMGFDYLWLSNGFGFGTETWGTTGAIFNGTEFSKEKIDETQKKILEFWTLFRKECPDIRLETRGTNLTAGIDLSTDGVPLKAIYDGGFNILPPPNSPWAALNGDFGLELAGYMSKIAELPQEDDYIYRFYVHDPWWMNSPWLDRYEGKPHDIYLPLAISRINGKGEVCNPNHLNILTVDNSLGDMPEQCPVEIIPHLHKAYEHQPDAISPFVWVYPFGEYHKLANTKDQNIEKPFFEDWFIRGAINHGLPLSSVVSTDNFISTLENLPNLYKGSVVFSTVPLKDSSFEEALIRWVKSGGKLVIYGSVKNAGARLMDTLNLSRMAPLEGYFDLDLNLKTDELSSSSWPQKIRHRALMSDGGIETVLRYDDGLSKVLATLSQGKESRVVALYRCSSEWKGGGVVWIRGTNSNEFSKGEHLLIPDNESAYFHMDRLTRLALQEFGYGIGFCKRQPQSKEPVITINRNDNAFFFSGYVPDTTVAIKFRFPLGAPLLMGSETMLENGHSIYFMPRSWHNECRIFVEQVDNTLLSCREHYAVSYIMKRRIVITGLKNATLRIFPQKGYEEKTEVLLNSPYPHIVGEKVNWQLKDTPWGKVIEVTDVTGDLLVSN